MYPYQRIHQINNIIVNNDHLKALRDKVSLLASFKERILSTLNEPPPCDFTVTDFAQTVLTLSVPQAGFASRLRFLAPEWVQQLRRADPETWQYLALIRIQVQAGQVQAGGNLGLLSNTPSTATVIVPAGTALQKEAVKDEPFQNHPFNTSRFNNQAVNTGPDHSIRRHAPIDRSCLLDSTESVSLIAAPAVKNTERTQSLPRSARSTAYRQLIYRAETRQYSIDLLSSPDLVTITGRRDATRNQPPPLAATPINRSALESTSNQAAPSDSGTSSTPKNIEHQLIVAQPTPMITQHAEDIKSLRRVIHTAIPGGQKSTLTK